jgi:hypothetical protein
MICSEEIFNRCNDFLFENRRGCQRRLHCLVGFGAARHPSCLRKGTSSMILLTAWWILKHRNAAVFDNTRPCVASLLDTIKAEAREWAEAGARGVRQLLP